MLPAFLALVMTAAPGGKWLEGVVNINTATVDELQLLPGVGPAKVRNIVAYRRAHPFRTADELVRIKGIGRKMVRRLRPHLAVKGPTTARAAPRPPPPPAPSRPPPPPPRPPLPPRPPPPPPRLQPPPKHRPALLARRPGLPLVSSRPASPPPRFRAARGNHCEPRS